MTSIASRIFAVLLVLAPGRSEPSAFEFTEVHMGLPVRLVLHVPDRQAAESAARAAFARIARLDRMMSDYRPDSELRGLDARAGDSVPVSPELLAVVSRALEISRATDGAFDPTIGPLVALWREARSTGRLPEPARLAAARASVGWQHVEIDAGRSAIRLARPGMRLDLGGVAKGYILQEALRALRDRGVTRALVESGGDIVAGNAPPGREGWHVDAPGAGPALAASAARLTNAALATSGSTAQFVEIDGIRYSHIVDPRTGVGVTTGLVARVIAGDAATADGLATALAVLGSRGVGQVRARYPSVIVDLAGGPEHPERAALAARTQGSTAALKRRAPGAGTGARAAGSCGQADYNPVSRPAPIGSRPPRR